MLIYWNCYFLPLKSLTLYFINQTERGKCQTYIKEYYGNIVYYGDSKKNEKEGAIPTKSLNILSASICHQLAILLEHGYRFFVWLSLLAWSWPLHLNLVFKVSIRNIVH